MNDENIVNLTGHLGQDPDIREKVATFRLAVSKSWYDQQAKEWREKTTWLTIATFAGNIAVTQAYLRKGVKVRLKCHLDVSKWDKGDGPKSKIDVIADEIAIVPKVEESQATAQPTPPPAESAGEYQQPPQEEQSHQAPPASTAATAGGGAPAFGASGRKASFGSRGGVFGKRNVFARNSSPSPEPAQAPAPEPQPRTQPQPEPRREASPSSVPPAPPAPPSKPTGRTTRSATGGYIRSSEPDLDNAPLGMHFGRGS